MTRVAVRAVFFSAAILGLAACEDGLNLGQGGTDSPESANATVRLSGDTATRDVERPDIFQTTEEALWDGRPSLGGIWVAHPDVTTPERAIVTNTSTNQRIAAAPFRRERANPGPRVQLSSEAAAALNEMEYTCPFLPTHSTTWRRPDERLTPALVACCAFNQRV